jgi:hypothetical protein
VQVPPQTVSIAENDEHLARKELPTMSVAAKNIPAALQPQENVSILLVSPHASDEADLRAMLGDNGAAIHRHATVSDASERLGEVAVVVCERDLPDGTWQDLLALCTACSDPPLMTLYPAVPTRACGLRS